jgi:glycosyltransferase involved in cell wall biosynthesis
MIDPGLTGVQRVWMNVTSSANWDRPAVGVLRVEQELFRALRSALGENLSACRLSEGVFVHAENFLSASGDNSAAETPSFAWPDPSFDFPSAATFEPINVRGHQQRSRRALLLESGRERQANFRAGDALVTVGLDWDYQSQGLESLLYKLKTKQLINTITCCYDLIPVLFPQYCVGDVAARFKEYFTNLTWSSSAMLCISKRSEADYLELAEQLGMPRIPTKVIPLGNNLPEANGEISDDVRMICDKRFVLYVATIERRKNHDVLYKALHILAERKQLDPEFRLVFVGMPGWGVADLLKDIELDPLTKGHIIQMNHASDADLRALYEHCAFFVYPSLYEGWGLPVAEALASGKFVIASSRGSIPEVGGDLVDYVDPWNASAWADTISQYWDDAEVLAYKTESVRRNYKPVPWDETALAVLELMRSLASTHSNVISIEPGHQMRSVSGLSHGHRIVSTGRGGTFCHGPYCPLPKGTLRIVVEIEVLEAEPFSLDFAFVSDGGTVALRSEVRHFQNPVGRHSLKFEFRLDQDVEDFELVITEPTDVIFAFEKMTIHILSEELK